MKSNTYKTLLNENKNYSTFEIPKGISFTRVVKKTKACINFSLYFSEDSGEAGMVCFESIKEAKKVLEFNKDRKDIKSLEIILKIKNKWYKEDAVTLRYPEETTIWTVKKELGIKDSDIAVMFGYKNTNSYATSSAKKRIEKGLVAFYELINVQ